MLKVHPSNYRVVGFTAGARAGRARDARAPLGDPARLRPRLRPARPAAGLLSDEPSAADRPRRRAPTSWCSPATSCSAARRPGSCSAGRSSSNASGATRSPAPCGWTRCRSPRWSVVLGLHAAERRDELPVWRMLRESPTEVRRRAELLARALDGDLEGAHVVASESTVGGGSVPGTVASVVRRRGPGAGPRRDGRPLALGPPDRVLPGRPSAACCSTSGRWRTTTCRTSCERSGTRSRGTTCRRWTDAAPQRSRISSSRPPATSTTASRA